MNEMKVVRGLGWFSIGLGAAEVVAGQQIGRGLGLEGRGGLLRLYGAREIATGVGILASRDPAPWAWARVAGDALDLATVAAAYRDENPRKWNAGAALIALGGVAALDYWCARRLHSARPHGSPAEHRANVADGSAPHYRQDEGLAPGS